MVLAASAGRRLHDVAKALRATAFIKTQNPIQSPSVQSPYEYTSADKSLARPERKQANVSVRMA